MKFYTFLILISFCACSSSKNTPTLYSSSIEEQKDMPKSQKHPCGEYTLYPVNQSFVFYSMYSAPNQCFDPHVKNPNMAIENKRRKLFLNIIATMVFRPDDRTGEEQLDWCWEKVWKYDSLPEEESPNYMPSGCTVEAKMKKEYVETVKKIERCRVSCAAKAPDPFEEDHEIDIY